MLGPFFYRVHAELLVEKVSRLMFRFRHGVFFKASTKFVLVILLRVIHQGPSPVSPLCLGTDVHLERI